MPTNNAGLLRTELQAISGNPNLYLRSGGVPTVSHYSNGYSGFPVYDRSLVGAQNTEYGNWVPLDGRAATNLSPGLWVVAIQAGGNSNARYRLRASHGNPVVDGLVQLLPANGNVISNQTLAGSDWRFYRFVVPTNPPASYSLTFSRTLGGARIFVRDTTPPGDLAVPQNYDAGSGYYYYYPPPDWSLDNKNQGPYPRFTDPGMFSLPTPPLRPGTLYYLGVWSASDTTFALSLVTNGPAFAITNTVPFYGGLITNLLPPGSVTYYRIDVPSDGTRLKVFATNSPNVILSVEQGTIAQTSGGAHWRSSGANPALNYSLPQAGWPWLPGFSYYLAVNNTSGSTEPFSLFVDGRNILTDDDDNDGLPDPWEYAYFGNTYQYNGSSDPDGDGVDNATEFADGTSPTDANSAKYTLSVTSAVGGTTLVSPPGPKYFKGTSTLLTATASAGFNFAYWTGTIVATNNPLTFIVQTNASLMAVFSSQPPVLAIVPAAANRFRFALIGRSGVSYGVQTSSNLLNWASFTNVLGSNGPVVIEDPISPGTNNRFYRAVVMP